MPACENNPTHGIYSAFCRFCDNNAIQGLAMPTPKFSIFKHDKGTLKVETLQHCFMGRQEIDAANPPAIIKAADGLVYTAVYDSRLPQTGMVPVIISFQQHTYGRFAVIRLVRGH